MKNYLLDDWLIEADMTSPAGPGDPSGGQAPATDPYGNQFSQNQSVDMTQQNNPNVTNMDAMAQQQSPEDDVSQDPNVPDMPQEKPKVDDFEVWKNQFIKESIKGDTQRLIDMLSMVRDKEEHEEKAYNRKFIEDNWNVQLLRMNANIEKAGRDIRKNIKDQIDRYNPATTVVNHMAAVLETVPTLNQVFIKLRSYGNLKGDLHRKFIAALIGGVQVGSGAGNEDVIYNDREYSILISTRFNSEWGEVMIGNWNMREDDPDRYLTDPEKKRLEEGSPEEKDVIRKRIIMDSIAHQYETRAFIINVVGGDGTIYTLGWDIAGSLRAAYTAGTLIVKTRLADNSEAMITDEGQIVPFMDVDIFYAKETGQQRDDGMPEVEEIPFLEQRNGTLFLKASLKTIKQVSSVLQGIALKEVPYNGNPSDLKMLSRCVYSSSDLLLKMC